MSQDLLCALDLPMEHSLWQTLRNLGYGIHRLTGPAHLERLAAQGLARAALAGPNLAPPAVALLAGRLEESGLPLVVVLPPGCTGPPVPVESPVYGYLPADSGPSHTAAVLTAAIQVFGYVSDLGTRLRRLQAHWEERKVVERAKGVLMVRQGISEEQAHRLLRESSMRLRQRMSQFAESILAQLPAATKNGA